MNASLMIVDDAKDQIYLMQMLMKTIAPDIAILTAGDGDEAIRQLHDVLPNLPRLILMDLKLLGKTGIETLKVLKSDPALKRIPVCIFSNGDFQADVCDAYEAGASFYFKKPIGLTNLKQFMTHLIEIGFSYAAVCAS